MKKLLALCIIGLAALFTTYTTQADDTVTLACDPPTHRVANGDCTQQGTQLTPAEIDSLEYQFLYRKQGSTQWTVVSAQVPTTSLTLPGYNVLYEAQVGARLPGGSVLCLSEVLEYTTGPDTSPPGACSSFAITK